MPNDRDLIPGETELLHVNRHPLVMVKRVLLPSVVVLAIVIGGALVRLPATLRDLRWFVLLALLLVRHQVPRPRAAAVWAAVALWTERAVIAPRLRSWARSRSCSAAIF